MKADKRGSFMERLASLIVDKRNIIFLIFTALAIFCAFSRNWVQVCDDITKYLPDNTETRTGLDLMEREFTTFGHQHNLRSRPGTEKRHRSPGGREIR